MMQHRTRQTHTAPGVGAAGRSRLNAVLDEGIRQHFLPPEQESQIAMPEHVQQAYAVIKKQPWTTMGSNPQNGISKSSANGTTETLTHGLNFLSLRKQNATKATKVQDFCQIVQKRVPFFLITFVVGLIFIVTLLPSDEVTVPSAAETAETAKWSLTAATPIRTWSDPDLVEVPVEPWWLNPLPRRPWVQESTCFSLSVPASPTHMLMNIVNYAFSTHKFLPINNSTLTRALIKTLPVHITPAQVVVEDLIGYQLAFRVCLEGNDNAHADDLLEVVLADSFPCTLASNMGLTLVYITAPGLMLTEFEANMAPIVQREYATQIPPPPPPAGPPECPRYYSHSVRPSIAIAIHGGNENPEDDDITDVALWANEHTTLQFSGSQQVYQYDYVYFTPAVYGDAGYYLSGHTHGNDGYPARNCMLPPVNSDLSGFLDADLQTFVCLSPGIYHLCLRQGTVVTHHAHAVSYTHLTLPTTD